MGDARTIAIDVGEEGVRHFNVDNIAYLEVRESEPTAFASVLMIGVPLLVGAVTWLVVSWLVAAVVAGGLFLVVATVVAVVDSVTIGTVNDSYELETATATEIESEFEEASRETLTVEGSREDTYNVFEYRYHVVPDNVVSVSYEPGRSFPVQYVFYALAFVFGGPVLSTESGVVGLVGFVVFAAAGYYASPHQRPDEVTVDLQGAETKTFLMNQDDRRRFLTAFGARTGGPTSIRDRKVRVPGEG